MDLDLDMQRRLLYILNRSLTELGLLTLSDKSRQAYDLTQAVENIPRHLMVWGPASLEEIRRELSTYQQSYHSGFDYLGVLSPDYCSSEELLE